MLSIAFGKYTVHMEDGNTKDTWRTQKVSGQIPIQGTHRGHTWSIASGK